MFESHKWVKMECKYEKLIFSRNSQENIWRTIFLAYQHIKLMYFADRPNVTHQIWYKWLRGTVTLWSTCLTSTLWTRTTQAPPSVNMSGLSTSPTTSNRRLWRGPHHTARQVVKVCVWLCLTLPPLLERKRKPQREDQLLPNQSARSRTTAISLDNIVGLCYRWVLVLECWKFFPWLLTYVLTWGCQRFAIWGEVICSRGWEAGENVLITWCRQAGQTVSSVCSSSSNQSERCIYLCAPIRIVTSGSSLVAA